MTCIALDDEPLALELLKTYIGQLPELQAKGFFTNPDAAYAVLENGSIDLLFLDIQMPDITGLEFFRALQHPPMVIFTTAYAEFAVEGFTLDALDYLLKPIDFERFRKSVIKALEYAAFLKSKKSDTATPINSLFVKSEYSVVQIPFDELICLEAFDDYVKIYHARSSKPLLTLDRLKNLYEKLPQNRFIQVHRSYVIAIEKMTAFRRSLVTLQGGKEVPVGEKYLGDLRAILG
ncbi:MAG: LytTR family DNA-binding domain-containing protein [Bacteroidota bacterium]